MMSEWEHALMHNDFEGIKDCYDKLQEQNKVLRENTNIHDLFDTLFDAMTENRDKLEAIKKHVKDSEKILKSKIKETNKQAKNAEEGGAGRLAIENMRGWGHIDRQNDKAKAYDRIKKEVLGVE